MTRLDDRDDDDPKAETRMAVMKDGVDRVTMGGGIEESRGAEAIGAADGFIDGND